MQIHKYRFGIENLKLGLLLGTAFCQIHRYRYTTHIHKYNCQTFTYANTNLQLQIQFHKGRLRIEKSKRGLNPCTTVRKIQIYPTNIHI